MSNKLQSILLALGLSLVFAFAIGCSEDDDENNTNPPTPTYAERLVGHWWAIDIGPQLGSDSARFVFRADSTFHYVEYFTGLDAYVTRDGHYSATEGGDITFHVSLDDSTASDTTITWSSGFASANDDTLRVDHDFGSGPATTVTYINVTPPVN
jgi:hypothetical protein